MLVGARPSVSAVLVPKLSVPSSTFASGIFVSMLGLSAPLSILSVSGVFVSMPGLSAPPSLLSVAGVSVPVPGLSALPSMSSVSGVSVPVPGLSTSLGLSPLLFPTWSFPQRPTPVPGRQKLSQQSGIIKRASSKEAPPTFVPPSEYLSLLLFLSSGIGKKQLFNKTFNINC